MAPKIYRPELMTFTSKQKWLVDSDFLVGAFRFGDPHHGVAMTILKQAMKASCQLKVINLVLHETATVLSHRTGMNAARLFWRKHRELRLDVILIDSELEAKAWSVFFEQTKKGTSFVDCANLAVIRHFKLEGILSFDRFYPAKIRVSTS